ncbi:response regulator [Streptomyces silvensis]|uniref:LuxR family transcriptional regulator n=1 Tax=Streptomyces silvensis TaxID=1765722 RepID=A0A0W7X4T8_9ACTN|nr:response regulator transcription factor [Streptomyces silvensis]KUF17853.1 LuxR family transcriptional regulator [Streptomyces silvensis]
MTIRVLIADDQAMVRDAFSVLLGAHDGIDVVGTARDGAEAVALAAHLRPDVIVMDIRMPGVDGIEATRTITAAPAAHPRILVLTTFDLDEYVYEALRAGATGFLLKDASGGELAEAVRVVAGGDALLSPDLTRRLIGEFARIGTGPGQRSDARVEKLTGRETEVLVRIAQGLSNAEIAAALTVAEETVKTHVGRVLHKLHLRDRTQAAVFAYECGLVVPGRPAP